MLSEVSRLLKITIVGGSIPERSGDRLYNTCCVFGTDGKLKAKHRKVMLSFAIIDYLKLIMQVTGKMESFCIFSLLYPCTRGIMNRSFYLATVMRN